MITEICIHLFFCLTLSSFRPLMMMLLDKVTLFHLRAVDVCSM